MLISWHEGAVCPAPSSCMVLLAGQVSLGQILSKNLWETQTSIACKNTSSLCFSQVWLYILFVSCAWDSWRKTHKHKDTEILRTFRSGSVFWAHLSQCREETECSGAAFSFFNSLMLPAGTKHMRNIKTRGSVHQVTEYMRCGNWETGFSWWC